MRGLQHLLRREPQWWHSEHTKLPPTSLVQTSTTRQPRQKDSLHTEHVLIFESSQIFLAQTQQLVLLSWQILQKGKQLSQKFSPHKSHGDRWMLHCLQATMRHSVHCPWPQVKHDLWSHPSQCQYISLLQSLRDGYET